MFKVPSDPPSTPDRRSLRSIPSTTPAGPPPSSTRHLPSFTPKGAPPPSSTFGSSQFGGRSSKPLFSNQNSASAAQRGRQLPPSSPPEIIEDEDAEGDYDLPLAPHPPQEDSMMIDDSIAQISPGFGLMKSINNSSRFDSPRGNKRSRGGDILRQARHVPKRIEGLDVQGYAKGVAASAGTPRLDDPDDLVLDTEQLVEPLLAGIRARAGPEELAEVAGDLLKTWQSFGALRKEDIDSDSIGPLDEDAGIAKANMVASLLLNLHIPKVVDGQILDLPRTLLDWLDNNHDPSIDTINEVLTQQRRGYYAAGNFWDAVYLALNRGRFGLVIKLLNGARFEDNAEQEFDERQSEGIEFAISEAIQVLEQCPAVTSQNWDVKGSDWTLFRHRIEKAAEQLREYAEAESGNASMWSQFGRSDKLSMSQRSRRVDSNVPFELYEPLQDMYKQLLGDPSELLKSCFDWLEAAITLTVWWDGNEGTVGRGSLAASRQPGTRHARTREVDLNPLQAYRGQLASSLMLAVEEEDVREGLDVTNPMHLGLACVVLDDVEQAIDLVKTWSMPITCAITELAVAGHWMATTGGRGAIENFDKSDLMVLSYGQPSQKGSKKDEVLELYADLLAQRTTFVSSTSEAAMDGWEMALRVLGRLDDTGKAESKVAELLDGIKFKNGDQVDNVLMLCNDLGFGQYAMTVSEKYADTLSDSSHNYGDALLYYLRAHKFTKAKKVIDVLISSSLVQSTAYPPKDKLDARMKDFIQSPKDTLNSLATIDFEAAQRLASWLSGYATLRKFYDLRDSSTKDDRDAERKRNAAASLLAVITSANDPIRGGLFDPSTEVVVPVDSLLVLLGESLPLLRASPPAFTLTQLFTLLKAVEDLTAIGPRIYAQCDSLFHTALENAYGADVPSPRAMLRKEASGMTASSQFSLVGSSLLNSQEGALAASGEDSGVLVSTADVRRGWDWRKGLKRTAKGEDVLKIVRLQLAEKVADAWADGEE